VDRGSWIVDRDRRTIIARGIATIGAMGYDDEHGRGRIVVGHMRSGHPRKRPRWAAYDYTQPGAYFVTAVTRDRRPFLGKIWRGGVVLTERGRIVERWWLAAANRFPGVAIDALVVMPDHVHAIVVLSLTPSRTVGLSQVVGWVKQRASREINLTFPDARDSAIWQYSFHDRIIRDAHALRCIRRYIALNPVAAWRAGRWRPSPVPG
jgi:REP-associated tyrosine transposase